MIDQVTIGKFTLIRNYLNYTYTLKIEDRLAKPESFEKIHDWINGLCNGLQEPQTLKEILEFIIAQS